MECKSCKAARVHGQSFEESRYGKRRDITLGQCLQIAPTFPVSFANVRRPNHTYFYFAPCVHRAVSNLRSLPSKTCILRLAYRAYPHKENVSTEIQKFLSSRHLRPRRLMRWLGVNVVPEASSPRRYVCKLVARRDVPVMNSTTCTILALPTVCTIPMKWKLWISVLMHACMMSRVWTDLTTPHAFLQMMAGDLDDHPA